MQAIVDQGTTPEFVSLGNEMQDGILFPYGRAAGANWAHLATFLKAGYQAVKEVSPSSRVVLHLDDAGNYGKYVNFFDKMEELGVEYDVIGPSYYPFWTNKTVEEAVAFFNYISDKYDKDILVMETGYKWNATLPNGDAGQLTHNGPYPNDTSTPEGQKNFMIDLFNGLKSSGNGRVIGDLYWDPIMIAVPGVGWAIREADDQPDVNVVSNTTLFDFEGKLLPVHDAYLILPSLIFLIIFNYIPMAGIVMSFQDFKPWLGILGSDWIGLDNYRFLFERKDSLQVIWNTLLIAGLKIIFNLLVPFTFAIFLNEIRILVFKRIVQTFVYLPHFLSWVILGGILLDILSTDGGIVNRMLAALGLPQVFFLGNGNWFRVTVIVSDVWKEFGFGTIVFLAALANINPTLYEAAEVDGASRFKQTIYITIPAMIPIAIVVGTLSLGNILNAGFDQIFNLYNPLVYEKGDIIDTFVYRVGILSGEFGFGTAIGLFKSVVSMILICLSYYIAYRWANYRIF